jgi:hypothetical protein
LLATSVGSSILVLVDVGAAGFEAAVVKAVNQVLERMTAEQIQEFRRQVVVLSNEGKIVFEGEPAPF